MKSLNYLCLTITVLFITLNVFAQKQANDSSLSKGNIIKLNLSALVFKNISVQYERKVGPKTTVALNVHTIPFGTIAFKKGLEDAIDDPSVDLDKLKIGNFGFTPEFRYYVGKKGAFHGFYLGPFVNYNQYKADLPINYDNDTKTGVFSGKLNAFTFGLQLGAQWKLGKNVYLDWWIIGPNYGSAKGDLIFNGDLSDPQERQALEDELAELKEDVPLDVIKSYQVTSTGATINAKGPWAGLRGLGINIGFVF